MMIIMAAGFSGCSSPKSQAYQAYLDFLHAQEVTHNCEVMYAMTEDQAITHVDRLCKPIKYMDPVLHQEVYLGSPMNMIKDMEPAHTPFFPMFNVERTLISQTYLEDRNQVELVIQSLYKNKVMFASLWEPTQLLKHTVTLRQSGSGWKITGFIEDVLETY